MYPLAQTEFPQTIDPDTIKVRNRFTKKFLKNFTIKKRKNYRTSLPPHKIPKIEHLWDTRRIQTVADMQFRPSAGKSLLKPPVTFKKSKKTGKIRQIFSQETHVLSMRAHDGLFTLKINGGKTIHKALPSPTLRLIVNEEAIPFIRKGKSVFSKFVIKSDPKLRPYDECLIVDNKDILLAVGRCLLNAWEISHFNNGVAAKTRESIKII